MENTLENKAKFFALYYGQEVANITHPFENHYMGTVEGLFINDVNFLELTPLSQITDEDAIELANKCKHDDFAGLEIRQLMMENNSSWIEYFTHYETQFAFDYLRSKSYALPWLDTTVEQQIEFGWVKLKE